MAKRPGVLEFAVLGILHESPMHGYELRKRCNASSDRSVPSPTDRSTRA
jgi:DNA-binding PadR family transcriptional regulator